MASRLEARVAGWMDYGHLKWKYEPSVLRHENGMYIPDFRVGKKTYVEVKPWLDDDDAHAKLIDDLLPKLRVLFKAVENPFCWLVYSNGFCHLLHDGESWDWIRGWLGLCCNGHLVVVSNRQSQPPNLFCQILTKHWPDDVHGDIRAIDWAEVECALRAPHPQDIRSNCLTCNEPINWLRDF